MDSPKVEKKLATHSKNAQVQNLDSKKQKTSQVILIPKTQKKENKTPKNAEFDINKLAIAVAKHETANFTKGYGATHNNGQGIKHGNTVPCPGVPKGKMCRFESREASNEAFKIIWEKWYGGMPTLEKARRWSGNDRAEIWKHIS